MDTVFIEDLRIETVIGIYDWERKIRQVVALDLEMAFDNRKPAASDKIADTLRPFPLKYGACHTCWVDGVSCRT